MKNRVINSFSFENLIILICAVGIGSTSMLYTDDVPLKTTMLAMIVINIPIHFFLLKLLFTFFERIKWESFSPKYTVENDVGGVSRKWFFIYICIFAINLLIFYPGLCGWDTEYQLVDLFDGIQTMHRDSWGDYCISYTFSDHMNLFDTFLFGGFVKVGMVVGNTSIGVFIYSLLQMLFYAFVCAKTVAQFQKWGLGSISVNITGLFYAIMPLVWNHSINMLKDSLNAAFLALYVIHMIGIIRRDQKIGWKLFALTMIISLTKKTGILLMVPSNVLLLIFFGKKFSKRERMLLGVITLAPILIISILLQKIVYPKFQIYQDSFQETFAFAFQQIGRCVKYYKSDFTSEDIRVIDRVLDYHQLASFYDYHIVDYVKDTFRPTTTKSELIDFFCLWIREGVRRPIAYIKSVIGTSGGFFSPTYTFDIYNCFNDWGNLGITNPASLKGLRTIWEEMYNVLTEIPIVGSGLQVYIYSWVLPSFACWSTIKDKSKEMLVAFAPMLISIPVFILSPTVMGRYVIHMVILAPFMLFVRRGVFF